MSYRITISDLNVEVEVEADELVRLLASRLPNGKKPSKNSLNPKIPSLDKGQKLVWPEWGHIERTGAKKYTVVKEGDSSEEFDEMSKAIACVSRQRDGWEGFTIDG